MPEPRPTEPVIAEPAMIEPALIEPTLIEDLRNFLLARGYTDVFETLYPDAPDEILSLHERENPLAFGRRGIHLGARAAKVTLRVRCATLPKARAMAWALFKLLDSGADEREIVLSPGRVVTGRPLPPFYLERDAKGRHAFALKVTLITEKP